MNAEADQGQLLWGSEQHKRTVEQRKAKKTSDRMRERDAKTFILARTDTATCLCLPSLALQIDRATNVAIDNSMIIFHLSESFVGSVALLPVRLTRVIVGLWLFDGEGSVTVHEFSRIFSCR